MNIVFALISLVIIAFIPKLVFWALERYLKWHS